MRIIAPYLKIGGKEGIAKGGVIYINGMFSIFCAWCLIFPCNGQRLLVADPDMLPAIGLLGRGEVKRVPIALGRPLQISGLIGAKGVGDRVLRMPVMLIISVVVVPVRDKIDVSVVATAIVFWPIVSVHHVVIIGVNRVSFGLFLVYVTVDAGRAGHRPGSLVRTARDGRAAGDAVDLKEILPVGIGVGGGGAVAVGRVGSVLRDGNGGARLSIRDGDGAAFPFKVCPAHRRAADGAVVDSLGPGGGIGTTGGGEGADVIAGTASLSITLNIICVFDAPKDFAASITPGSTSFKADSITLATNGAAAIVSGTIAAVVPIDFPTNNFVIGIIATINIKNGKPLRIFIIVSNIL